MIEWTTFTSHGDCDDWLLLVIKDCDGIEECVYEREIERKKDRKQRWRENKTNGEKQLVRL